MTIPNHTHQSDTQGGQLDLAQVANRPGSLGAQETADGAISARRLVEIDASGDLVEATTSSRRVIGINAVADAKAIGDAIVVAIGRVTGIADQVIDAGRFLKAAVGGRLVQLVDSVLSGTTIDTSIGAEFTNQPANDGVEVVSDDAGDNSQSLTIWGTTTGTDTVVVETVALNGTTVVPTVKADWGEILAVELDGVAAGTVTVREASADLTITTLAPAALTSGIVEVPVADQRAFNAAPTAVGDGAEAGKIGLIGTDISHAALSNNSIALNGVTAVTFPVAMSSVTRLLTGDYAAATTATVAVGAEDDELLKVGKSIGAAAAIDTDVLAMLLP